MHLALLPALMLNTRPKPGLTCLLLWSSCTATPTLSHLPTAADLTALRCARPSVVSLPVSCLAPLHLQSQWSLASSRPLHTTLQATDVCELTRERLFAPVRSPRAWQTQEAAGRWVCDSTGPGCLWRRPCAPVGAVWPQGLSLSSRAKHLLLQRRRWTWKLYF